MCDRASLEAIELIERVFVRYEADEVKDVIVFCRHLRIFVHNKRVLASE